MIWLIYTAIHMVAVRLVILSDEFGRHGDRTRESKDPYSCEESRVAAYHSNKVGIAGEIGIPRLLAPTPQQAQTRCLLGTPFALVARDDTPENYRYTRSPLRRSR